MISLTAQMQINSGRFKLGESQLGLSFLVNNPLGTFTQKIDRRNMISLEGELMDRGTADTPSFGIISNGGQMVISDNDGRFKIFYIRGIINKNTLISLYLNDTLKRTSKPIGNYYAKNIDYDTESHTAIISLTDGLEEWQNIKLPFMWWLEGDSSLSFADLYNRLYEYTPKKYKMLALSSLDAETQTILFSNYCNQNVGDATLWGAWTMVCEAIGAYIFKDANEYTILRYGRGS